MIICPEIFCFEKKLEKVSLLYESFFRTLCLQSSIWATGKDDAKGTSKNIFPNKLHCYSATKLPKKCHPPLPQCFLNPKIKPQRLAKFGGHSPKISSSNPTKIPPHQISNMKWFKTSLTCGDFPWFSRLFELGSAIFKGSSSNHPAGIKTAGSTIRWGASSSQSSLRHNVVTLCGFPHVNGSMLIRSAIQNHWLS